MLVNFNGSGGFGGGFGGGDGGYNAHERCNDYYEYKSTTGGGGSGGSGGNHNKGGGGLPDWGLGWVVIIIVAILLISFIVNGASWAAIDSLLGLGFLAFLFFKSA